MSALGQTLPFWSEIFYEQLWRISPVHLKIYSSFKLAFSRTISLLSVVTNLIVKKRYNLVMKPNWTIDYIWWNRNNFSLFLFLSLIFDAIGGTSRNRNWISLLFPPVSLNGCRVYFDGAICEIKCEYRWRMTESYTKL